MMRSILTVVTPATDRSVTTVARMKAELELTESAQDTLLGYKIVEVSGFLDSHCKRVFAAESVSELFMGGSISSANRETGFYPYDAWGYGHSITDPHLHGTHLRLSRIPVAAIGSVTLDGTVLDPSEYQIDPETGQLHHLDSGGLRIPWWPFQALTVAYSGGYLLPSQNAVSGAPPLPADLVKVAVDLVKASWFARKRDPMQRSEGDTGVGQKGYWVGGAPGTDGLASDHYAILEKYMELRF